MGTNRERRNLLKAGATGAAWSLLGAGSLAARAQGSDAPDIILKNGKIQSFNCYPSGTVLLTQLGILQRQFPI